MSCSYPPPSTTASIAGARRRPDGCLSRWIRFDTVYLRAYRRDVLQAAGGFDPLLTMDQDTEVNRRLRKPGEPCGSTRPRGTLRALACQYFDYGRWKPAVLRRHPAEMRPRHLASPPLVCALLAFTGAFGVAAALPLLYAAALILGAAAVGIRCRDAAAVLLPVVLATMHLIWGVGFLSSLQRPGADGSSP